MKFPALDGEARAVCAAAAVVVAASAAEAQPAPTFTHDIAPLVYAHCATCHRPGEIGPFSLLTYADVRQHARQIAEVTKNRVMPPWKPEPGRGEFLDSRALTADQIDVLQRWVAAGSPEGDL